MKYLFLLLTLTFIYLSVSNAKNYNLRETNINYDLDKILKEIKQNLYKERCTEDVQYSFFPRHSTQYKGLYKSYVHLNAMDAKNTFWASLKRNHGILDMNNFVTSMVLYSLFESQEYGQDFTENEIQKVEESLQGLYTSFKDKNFDDSVPIYDFWSQVKINGTWSQHPDNLNKLLWDFHSIAKKLDSPFFRKIYKFLHLDTAEKLLQVFSTSLEVYLFIFRIPADYDDTSINMGLTGIIHKYNTEHNSTLFSNWLNKNQRYEELFINLKKFAYRPFNNSMQGSEFNNSYDYQDLLDSRTYFWLHDWVREKLNTNNTNIILPTTWFDNLRIQKTRYNVINMPFSVNNIDLNVVSNFVFGLSSIMLYHKDSEYITKMVLSDSELKSMLDNSIDLMTYGIKNNLMSMRPDIILLYYPSIYDFYWLISRVYVFYKKHHNNSNLDSEFSSFLSKHLNSLENALKLEATNQIFSNMIVEGEDYYFTEFLGNNDYRKRNEDALFATSLVLNSLINIWTHDNKYTKNGTNSILEYDENTPDNVKSNIDYIAKFVMKSSLSAKIKKENAFFSGSVKSPATNEFCYPSNFNEYFNGTVVEDVSKTAPWDLTLVSGVRGYIEDETFQKMKNQTFYGSKVPLEMLPFNNQSFPYWSSPAITYSLSLSALSKYRSLGTNYNK